MDITSEKMPDELKNKLANLSPFARKYAEYRATGIPQPDAADKAGSKAKTRANLGKVGNNTERLDGVKDYIMWLEHKRAKAAVIDDLELVDKLRSVYREAMEAGKFNDANKAVEHLGNMIGAFDKKVIATTPSTTKETKNDTKAFSDEVEEIEPEDRIKKLKRLMKES